MALRVLAVVGEGFAYADGDARSIMTKPSTIPPASRTSRPISPSDLELPPTEPIDITALMAAELAARHADDPPG